MTLFQEIGGSPVENITVGGFSATRTFLVPWERRNEFASAVLGDGTQSSRPAYPGRNDVYATSIRFEPFDADAVAGRTMTDPASDLADYDGSFARAVVRYAIVDSIGREDAPAGEDGTSLSYRMLIESEAKELSAGSWRWQNTGAAIASPANLVKMLPYTLHVLTWSNVVDPPWSTVTALQGTVNNDAFLGCAASTLLFLGGEAHKLYVPGSGIDDEPSSFVWSIKYTFRERAVKTPGGVYGWNHEYNSVTGTWDVPRSGTSPLYSSGHFADLFRSGSAGG